MKKLIIIALAGMLVSCNTGTKKESDNASAAEEKSAPSLELIWESDTLLRTPESVLVDDKNGILYVSNLNMNPWEKDGNGFISKLDMEGNIIDLYWLEGLHGPKGMGIVGDKLYVADMDVVVEVDIPSASINALHVVKGDPELNDITTGDDGSVYVAGSNSNIIYRLFEYEITEVYAAGGHRFNGLLWEKDRMLLATNVTSQLQAIDLETGEMSIMAENMGHADGIAYAGNGEYVVSSWSGKVFHISAEGAVTTLLDTEELGMNTADIDMNEDGNIVYIPTFFDNRVKAYGLK